MGKKVMVYFNITIIYLTNNWYLDPYSGLETIALNDQHIVLAQIALNPFT